MFRKATEKYKAHLREATSRRQSTNTSPDPLHSQTPRLKSRFRNEAQSQPIEQPRLAKQDTSSTTPQPASLSTDQSAQPNKISAEETIHFQSIDSIFPGSSSKLLNSNNTTMADFIEQQQRTIIKIVRQVFKARSSSADSQDS